MPYARVKNELPLIPGYASGDIVTIDAAAAPLNKCFVDILPVQSGTGDPSPSNIRPITGHTELNLVQKDGSDTLIHTYTTDFGTTVYGGTLDVVSGVLTLTHEIKICKWADGISSADLGSYIRKRFPFSSSNYGKYPPTSLDYIMCDKAPYLYNFNSDTLHFYYNSNEVLLFMPEDTDGETLISVTFELATPTTIQLTPQEVKSILGQNNIFADSGDIDIIYIRRSRT